MSVKILYPIIFLILLLLRFSSARAQQNILLNQSSFNLFVLNPAAVGLNDELRTNCHYKKNWIGLSESPELMQLTIDGSSSKNKIGLGLNLADEKAGIFSKTYVSGAFSYKIKIDKKQSLSFGISGGFQKMNSDFSKIKADAPEEFESWPQQQSVTIPDAGFGLLYSNKLFYASGSATQILKQKYNYKEPTFNQEISFATVPQFVLAIQNTFALKRDVLKYMVHLSARSALGLPFQFDFVNSLIYKEIFIVGFGYRPSLAVYTNLGYVINDKLRILYSYEYSRGIHDIAGAGHEIGLSFGFNRSTKKSKETETKLQSNDIQEIYERLDQQTQQLELMNKRMDSLDKNYSVLKSQLEDLKNKQINSVEINEVVNTYLKSKETTGSNNNTADSKSDKKTNSIDKPGKYKVISPKDDKAFESIADSSHSNYKIVLGVYQLYEYAKNYQKFLGRELKIEARLVQLEDHPKKYIYVSTTKEYENLGEALIALKQLRLKIRSMNLEVTKGEAWILQTQMN